MQKYRLYLSRLQKEKENETKSGFAGMKHSEVSPKDPPGSFSLHNSTTSIHQSDVVNSSYIFPGNNLLPRSSSSHEDDLKSIISEPVMEAPVNLPDSHKTKNTQMGGFNQTFQPLQSEVNFAAFNPSIPTKSYLGEVSDVQLRQEHKPLVHLENGFSKLPLPDPLSHAHADPLQSVPSTAEIGLPGPTKSKPPCPEYGINQIGHISLKASIVDSFPLSSKNNILNYQALEPIYTCTSPLTTQASYLSRTVDMESAQRNVLNLGSGSSLSALASFEDDLQLLLQGEYYGNPLGIRSVGLLDYCDAGLINEVPIHSYDSVRFGYDYPCDLAEYALIDQAY